MEVVVVEQTEINCWLL